MALAAIELGDRRLAAHTQVKKNLEIQPENKLKAHPTRNPHSQVAIWHWQSLKQSQRSDKSNVSCIIATQPLRNPNLSHNPHLDCKPNLEPPPSCKSIPILTLTLAMVHT